MCCYWFSFYFKKYQENYKNKQKIWICTYKPAIVKNIFINPGPDKKVKNSNN